MRRRPGLDANHREIVKALRAARATVVSLAGMGGGVPDLLVGKFGETYLIEVKRPGWRDRAMENLAEKIRARDQQEWRDRWRGGPCVVVTSVDEALAWLEKQRKIIIESEVSRMFAEEVVAARRSPRRKPRPIP